LLSLSGTYSIATREDNQGKKHNQRPKQPFLHSIHDVRTSIFECLVKYPTSNSLGDSFSHSRFVTALTNAALSIKTLAPRKVWPQQKTQV
jgi:hypothetical protein